MLASPEAGAGRSMQCPGGCSSRSSCGTPRWAATRYAAPRMDSDREVANILLRVIPPPEPRFEIVAEHELVKSVLGLDVARRGTAVLRYVFL